MINMSELGDHSPHSHQNSDKCENTSNHSNKKLRKTNKTKNCGNNGDNGDNGNYNIRHKFDVTLNYLPKLFIRCHCKNNDAFDNSTSIWSATFQPQSRKSNGSEFVATCGGNSVCILDVKNANNSKNVISRFIDDDKNEEFVSLAWNVLPNSDTSDEKLILAVGGKRQILLMSTLEMSCYERIDAHDDQINALLFHKTDPFLLFSISYDGKIKLWRISVSAPNKSKLLNTVETRSPLLSLCHSIEHDCIIVSGFKGVMFWCDLSVSLTQTDNKQLCLGHLCFPKANQLVDGLVIIPDDPNTLALRAYKTKFITVIDLKSTIDEIKANNSTNSSKRQILLSKVQKFHLNWYNDTKYPYIYMSAQNGLLVSGAPNGQMYLYNTAKFESYQKTNQTGDPDYIVDWPAIDNIVQDNKYVIDDNKFVIINAVAISPDLKYIVGCTNLNLVCIWYRQ